ncbi:unnamed protein product [Ectocarpus sp. 12 AP-2014]
MHTLKHTLGRARYYSNAAVTLHACFGQVDKDNCTHEPENPRKCRGIGSEKQVISLARSGRQELETNEARKELPDRLQ